MGFKTIFSVLLTILLVGSLAIACFSGVQAQSSPKPSVPEFTASIIDKSYDVAPTTSVDPYNGQTITTKGYHVKNLALEIRIKNENFTPFDPNSGPYQVNYYYNIRWKGHFEENWANMFAANYGSGYFPRVEGAETVFSTGSEYSSGFNIPDMNDFSPNDQIDLQVEAMIGYVADPGPFESEVFVGEVSGWSNTQTVTVTAGSVSTSTSPSPAGEPVTPVLSAAILSPTATPVSLQAGDNYADDQLGWSEFAFVGLVVVIALLVMVVALLSRKIRVLERKLTD